MLVVVKCSRRGLLFPCYVLAQQSCVEFTWLLGPFSPLRRRSPWKLETNESTASSRVNTNVSILTTLNKEEVNQNVNTLRPSAFFSVSVFFFF